MNAAQSTAPPSGSNVPPSDPPVSTIKVVLQLVWFVLKLLLDNIVTLIGLVVAWSWYRQGRKVALLFTIPVASSLVVTLLFPLAFLGYATGAPTTDQ